MKYYVMFIGQVKQLKHKEIEKDKIWKNSSKMRCEFYTNSHLTG